MKEKPKIGQIVRVEPNEGMDGFTRGRVFAIYDSLDQEWEPGELAWGMEEVLEHLGRKADWFACLESVDYPGETVAVANFEIID